PSATALSTVTTSAKVRRTSIPPVIGRLAQVLWGIGVLADMSRGPRLTLICAALALFAAAPAQAQLKSGNVSLLAKLPDSAGAIGARFSPDGRTMYVSSATGLQVYDVSTPAAPRKLSQLPLPHFENEDVDVGRDTVVITNDPSFSGVGIIYLIDVS